MAKPRGNSRLGLPGLLLALAAILMVVVSPAPARARTSGEAAAMPWSGWWWPKKSGELVWGYNGRPSPVDKYDLYTSGRYPGSAFLTAANGKWYDPEAENWMGFCNGWVNASILEVEPQRDSVVNGILLKVGDKKGLLTACHASDVIQYMNCKNNPAVFHRYLVEYIGEKQQSVGADLDSTEQFWSYPIYAYEMDISSGTESDTVVCTIHYADDFVDYDFVGTVKKERTYTYTLDKDDEGNYIGTGKWLQGMPGDLHPEWVWVPVGIDQSKLFVDFAKVSEMAHSQGGDFQGASLVPGHHVLLVDPGENREFIIRPRPGEKLSCRLALDRQVNYGDGGTCRLLQDNLEIKRFPLGRELSENLDIVGREAGPQSEYRLVVAAPAGNQKTLPVHLLVDVESRYTAWRFGLPSDSYWLGCGVAPAATEAAGRAWLEVVDEQGVPVGCGAVAELDAGQSWLEVVDKASPIDYNFDSGKPAGVKLVTDFPQPGLFLAGSSSTLRGNPLPGPVRNPERRLLAIPWLVSASDMLNQGTFYLHNPTAGKVQAEIQYYKKDGTAGNVGHVSLAAGQIGEYKRRDYPGQYGIEGWALVSADGELQGAVESLNRSQAADALPLLGFGGSWMAPHAATSDGWSTVVGICNPLSGVLAVQITAIVDERAVAQPYVWWVPPHAGAELVLEGELFGLSAAELDRAWLRLESSSDFAGYLQFKYLDEARAAIPLQKMDPGEETRILTPMAVAGGWWTGVVLVNVTQQRQTVQVSVLDAAGRRLEARDLQINPQGRVVVSLAALFPGVDPDQVAALELDRASAVRALTLFGGSYGTQYLAAECW